MSAAARTASGRSEAITLWSQGHVMQAVWQALTLCGVCAGLWMVFTALVLAWSGPYEPCPLVVATTGVPTTGSGFAGFSSAAMKASGIN